jgi:ParB/RepB/Spo0J family partition protein
MAITCKKPLAWFKVKPQARKRLDEDELHALGRSLRDRQLQPVVALADGTLICGERRYRAAVLEGLAELEVKVIDDPISEAEFRRLQFTENIHRSDLTPYEKWQGCLELLRLNPGWTSKDLAESLHVAESTVTKYLSPSRCIAAVQDALQAGGIGITDCYAISLLPPEQQAGLLALKRSGASRDRILQEGRKRREGNAPTVRVSRIKCPLPTGVTVTVSGAGISLDDGIEAAAGALKAMRKAREDGLDSKTAQSVWRDMAKAGGLP